jgi:hypothetical protein
MLEQGLETPPRLTGTLAIMEARVSRSSGADH